MSEPRHITVDCLGRILEVTHLFDRHANQTNDPVLAVSCVIHFGGDNWTESSTDDVPIYTVH